ncbi:MAG TPA: hypothetical protein VG755_15850, partial [Nannocystaceae bacterium]|nr:hypothetical protein [Nannocystaceae bacterium]
VGHAGGAAVSSHLRRLIYNSRERLLSNDMNDAHSLQHRALIEGLAALGYGDTQQRGVLRGLTVSIPGGSLNVSVASGLALLPSTPATSYDSSTGWLELRSATSVDLSSYVDGAQPRWVAIEIAANDAAEVTSLRDIFLPASGTFTSMTVDKVRGSSPTISVTAGTPAATPRFPSGTAGRVPLAYVYIAAGAATLTVGDVVHCRPVLRPGNLDAFEAGVRDIRGGGVAVASAGSTVTLRECRGRFDQHTAPFAIPASTLAIGTTVGWDTAADPGADDVGYLYAIPAPYPSGYDASLAPREFRPETSAATRFSALVPAGVSGCVVIASTAEPNTATQQGAPTSGNFSIGAAPWTSTTVSVPRSRGVYLGAAMWDDSASGFVPQIEQDGWCWPTAAPGIPSTQIHDATVFISAASSVNVWSGILPTTALEVRCALVVQGGTATTCRIGFNDQTTNATGSGSHVAAWAGGVPTVCEYEFVAYPDASGNITFVSGAVTAATTDLGGADLRSMAYRDCVIARR